MPHAEAKVGSDLSNFGQKGDLNEIQSRQGRLFEDLAQSNHPVKPWTETGNRRFGHFGSVKPLYPFYGYHRYGHVGLGHKGKRDAGPDPKSPRGQVFMSIHSGWIPMPHSHLLVRGSRPYLTGKRRFQRGAGPDPEALPDARPGPEPVWFNAWLASERYPSIHTTQHHLPSFLRKHHWNKRSVDPEPYNPRGYQFVSSHSGYIPKSKIHVPHGYHSFKGVGSGFHK